MTTLKNVMAADAAQTDGVFFSKDSDGNPDEFAETVTFIPCGHVENAVSTTVIWDEDGLEGRNVLHGDGTTLEDMEGRAIRENVVVECDATLDLDDTRDDRDVFVRNGKSYQVKRILSRDPRLMSVLAVRVTRTERRAARRRG